MGTGIYVGTRVFFCFFFFWPPPRLALQVYSDAHFWHLARYGMDWAWKVVVKCKRVAFLGGRGGVEFYYFCLFGRSARVFFFYFFCKVSKFEEVQSQQAAVHSSRNNDCVKFFFFSFLRAFVG